MHRYAEVIILDDDYGANQSPWGDVLRELSDQEFEEQRIKHDQHALRKAIDDLKLKAASIEQEVDARVAKATANATQELEDERKRLAESRSLADTERDELQKQRAEIPAQVEDKVRQEVKARTVELEKKEQQLYRDFEHLEAREATLKKLAAEAEEFQAQGGPEFMAIIQKACSGKDEHRTRISPDAPPADLFKQASDRLSKAGYVVNDTLLVQFVLSTVTAAATGQLVLLSGPTGVGKTSLVHRMGRVLGAGPEEGGRGVVPVRPAWLDPADLLGFYNPTTGSYEPTPFIDELVNARRYADAGELYFLVLDEMNLARIENYGADFLAQLEKSREALRAGHSDDVAITLYAESISQRLRARLQDLVEQRQEVPDDSPQARRLNAEIASLRTQAIQTPSRLNIPPGLVLYGTLNADETTHPLSPKVRDRAFVLQLPASGLPTEPGTNTSGAVDGVWTLGQEFAMAIDPAKSVPEWVTTAWADITKWHSEALRPLEVHLSRRFPFLYSHYMAAASSLGLPGNGISEDDVVSGFVMAKVLPWISFHKDENVPGDTAKKRDVLKSWGGSESFKSGRYAKLSEALQGILDQASLTYEYVR